MKEKTSTQEDERGFVYGKPSLDIGFKEQISKLLGGRNVKLCYQCGMCTSGCPVAALTCEYKPDKILRMVLLGIRENLFAGETIWLCASCYTCQERCPQRVDVADLLISLRNVAVKESCGTVPMSILELARSLFETGRLVRVTLATNRIREELGLPSVSPKLPNEIQKIMHSSNFKKLLS